ncbi:MAG: hypothetical protein EOM45_04835 [Clostridia bacterium]|nr:hypothetical protein [Clostridia bacterium]
MAEDCKEPVKRSEKLRLNLYFDSVRRSEELVQLDIDITGQRQELQLLLEERQPLDDDQSLKRHFGYFKLQYDTGDRILKSFELDQKKVEKARRTCGFFSIMTHKRDMDAMETYHTYKLRDEQEKAFVNVKEFFSSGKNILPLTGIPANEKPDGFQPPEELAGGRQDRKAVHLVRIDDSGVGTAAHMEDRGTV